MTNKRIKKKQHKQELERRVVSFCGPKLSRKEINSRVNAIQDIESTIHRLEKGMQNFVNNIASVIKFVPSKTGGDDD